MKIRFPAAVAVAALPALTVVAEAFSPADAVMATEHGDCAQLTQLTLPDVRITEAAAVPAGGGHCRVAGVIGTEIKFVLLMPDTWNRKFLMGGGGGFVGTVQNQAQMVVNAGYATAGTDTGHSGGVTDASWALNHDERRINWAAAIDSWVESGKAPARIIAQKGSGAAVSRTRPLCPYPQHAVYSGSGSTDLAENFTCRP